MRRTPLDGDGGPELTILRDTPPWEWPEGTAERLLEILNDEETAEADRLIATDLAGDFTVINDALVGALLSIVRASEESETLRSMAAISLGPVLEHADIEGFDDPGAVPIPEETFRTIRETLRELYGDSRVPKIVRRRILEASVRAPEDWHEEAIRSAAAGKDREWLLTAVFCMGHVKGFDREIVEALADSDDDIRFEAVRAAGNWEVAEAEPRIVQIIRSKSPDKALLLAAIEAAGYICQERAGEVLAHLIHSEDEDIAEAVSEALLAAEIDDIDFDDEEDDDGFDEDDEDETEGRVN